jgi:hypothetical protein
VRVGEAAKGKQPSSKNNVSGDHSAVSGKIKAVIPFVIQGIVDEDTSGGTRSKLMQGCCG